MKNKNKNKNWSSERESYLPEVTQLVGGKAETRTDFQASVFSTTLKAVPAGALAFVGASWEQSMWLLHRKQSLEFIQVCPGMLFPPLGSHHPQVCPAPKL